MQETIKELYTQLENALYIHFDLFWQNVDDIKLKDWKKIKDSANTVGNITFTLELIDPNYDQVWIDQIRTRIGVEMRNKYNIMYSNKGRIDE